MNPLKEIADATADKALKMQINERLDAEREVEQRIQDAESVFVEVAGLQRDGRLCFRIVVDIMVSFARSEMVASIV